MLKITFMLYILMFYPSGKFEREFRPVEVTACQGTETADCGIQACMKVGRERAAVLWGQMPGLNFGIICRKPETGEELKEGTDGGSGHPALNFR
jgi:hypothetical protein